MPRAWKPIQNYWHLKDVLRHANPTLKSTLADFLTTLFTKLSPEDQQIVRDSDAKRAAEDAAKAAEPKTTIQEWLGTENYWHERKLEGIDAEHVAEKWDLDLQPGDELYQVDNQRWASLAGRSGYLLVRDGIVIEVVTTGIN